MAATTHQYVVALLTTDAVILDVDVRHHAAGALVHVTHVTVVFAVRAADGATGHVIAVVVATFGTLQRRRIHDIMSRFRIHIPPGLPTQICLLTSTHTKSLTLHVLLSSEMKITMCIQKN